QLRLRVCKQRAAVAMVSFCGQDANRVDPATVAVVAGHRGCDDASAFFDQPEQAITERELACDVRARITLWTRGVVVFRKHLAPERDDRFGIGAGDRTDAHATPIPSRRIHSAIARSLAPPCSIASSTLARSCGGRFWLSLNLPSMRSTAIRKPTIPRFIF